MTAKPPHIYSVGTLRYTQQQLYVLFFWLMWNDFSITLLEQIGVLNGFQLKNHGASNTVMALFGAVGGLFAVWLNPICSTWSDRLRTRYGRRRPFLFVSAPLMAASMMVVPFMPGFYHLLVRFPVFASLAGHVKESGIIISHHITTVLPIAAPFLEHLRITGPILFLEAAMILNGIFNTVLLAIFSYLYWDVVPENLLGRFNSLSKNITLIAGLIWSFYIYGLADQHMKGVYVVTSFFCLVVYLISVWYIKEGDYPPPDVHKKGGVWAPIRAYFVECFSDSFYIWIFVAMLANQTGNIANNYRNFYLYYDLHLSYSVIGWCSGWGMSITTVFGLVLGFYIGTVTDRLKPVRVMPYLFMAAALSAGAGFFYVHDASTYLISAGIGGVINFCQGVAFGAFQVEVFPREKLGQFCSAQAVFYQLIINTVMNPAAGIFFDYINFYRFSFIWAAFFYGLASLIYLKVFYGWKKRHGHVPVPHAG